MIFLVYITINNISLEAIFILKKKKFNYLEQFGKFRFVHTYFNYVGYKCVCFRLGPCVNAYVGINVDYQPAQAIGLQLVLV